MSFRRGTVYNFQDDTGLLIPLIFDYSVVAYPNHERTVYYSFYEEKKEYPLPKIKNKKYLVQDDLGMYKFMFFQEKNINKNNQVRTFLFINVPSPPIHSPYPNIGDFYRIPSVTPTYGSSKTGLDPTRTVRQNIGGKRRRTRRTRSHRPRR
jgi:hypothetical protein